MASGLLNLLGGAFSKYPIGAPVALGAAGDAAMGTLGNENSGWVGRNTTKDEEPNKNEHEIIWSTLVGKPEGPDYKRFLNSSVEDKARILHSHAKDTDDALWRSKEWMKIEGNPSANERMSLLDYGRKDQFGFGTSIQSSGQQQFPEGVVRNIQSNEKQFPEGVVRY